MSSASLFDSDKWPLGSVFGNGWTHVRRIAFNPTNPSWIIPRDDEGKPITGDNLNGFGTSQSAEETYAYILFYNRMK